MLEHILLVVSSLAGSHIQEGSRGFSETYVGGRAPAKRDRNSKNVGNCVQLTIAQVARLCYYYSMMIHDLNLRVLR